MASKQQNHKDGAATKTPIQASPLSPSGERVRERAHVPQASTQASPLSPNGERVRERGKVPQASIQAGPLSPNGERAKQSGQAPQTPIQASPLSSNGQRVRERGTPRWLAVQTKPRQEATAKQHLEHQNFEVLLPQVRERKRQGSRMQWQTTPMFPRYLFVRTNPQQQSIAPIRSTKGCVGAVRIGMQPAFVPQAVIDELRIRTEDPPEIDPCARWQPEQPLRITDGPMRGLTALFQARDGQSRAYVLLELLGQWQRTNIPLQVLEEAH